MLLSESAQRKCLAALLEQQEDSTLTDDAVEKDKDSHSEFLDNITELKCLKTTL